MPSNKKSDSDQNQAGLFQKTEKNRLEISEGSPLAFKARPSSFDDFVGHGDLFIRYPFLKQENFPSIVLWGPPGTGKTTLAYILANNSNKELFPFNAVLGGVKDLRKIIDSAIDMKDHFNKESIIFIDEIHRFNKAQQDALLPYVEAGAFTLIGATTENPRSSVIKALLSRVQLIELKRLREMDILKIVKKAVETFSINIEDNCVEFIADYSDGDARKGLNILDNILAHDKLSPDAPLSLTEVKALILENARSYDKNQDRHYDVISSFIKSLRGSDPDAAVFWLALMLDGGEDPVFIARRLVIFSSEDVGNADPQALTLATSALTAVSAIGMP